jgi:hypothetical protein
MASPSPNVSYTVCSPIDIVALMPHNNVQYLHDAAAPGRKFKEIVQSGTKEALPVWLSRRHRLYMGVWVVQV